MVAIIIIHLIKNNSKRNKDPTTGRYSGLPNARGCPAGTGTRRLLKPQLQSSTSSNTIAFQDEKWRCGRVIDSLCCLFLDPSFSLPGIHRHVVPRARPTGRGFFHGTSLPRAVQELPAPPRVWCNKQRKPGAERNGNHGV